MARYGGPILDAHHHLWRLNTPPHPWLNGGPGPLARDVLPADYGLTFADFPVVGTVWIEALAADPGLELQMAADWHAANPGLCNALVGHLPLDAPDIEDRLDTMLERQPLLRGIRDIVSHRPIGQSFARASDLLDRTDFCRGLVAVRERNLSFDLMLLPHQLHPAAALFERVEGLKLAIEHAGSPEDQSTHGLGQWRDGMAAFARRPNTVVKVSALHCLDPSWTLASLGRNLDPLVELFGPEKLCFGSDFPTHDLACPGPVALDSFLELTADWDPASQRDFFFETARDFYRVALPASPEIP